MEVGNCWQLERTRSADALYTSLYFKKMKSSSSLLQEHIRKHCALVIMYELLKEHTRVKKLIPQIMIA